MSTFGERLEQALTATGKTRAELAKRLCSPDGSRGVSPSAISQVVRGETKAFNAENCVRAAAYLGVSAFWLATGEGSMSPATQSLRVAEPEPLYLTPAAVLGHMAQLLRNVPVAQRVAVGDTLRGWAGEGGADHWQAMLLALFVPSKAVNAAR